MFKTMFAFGALALVAAAPAAAQMASGSLPRCSATVHDSCDQGADNANAISAEQAMKTGGVGDRGHDDAANMGGGKAMPMHGKMHRKMMHHHMMHHTMTKSTSETPATDAKPM